VFARPLRRKSVLAVVRNASLPQHDKLREIVHQDVYDLATIEGRLSGYDACFFCLGVSSVGMKEQTYRRVTYDLTVSVANTLAKLNPTMTFIYVSGAGTDSTERGRRMWARVKAERKTRCWRYRSRGSTCFAQLTFSPFTVFARRRHGMAHFYAVTRPFYTVSKMLFPNYVTTTECLGRAMLSVTKRGFPKPVLENRDINVMCAKDSK
jgi:hypothetical protein